jgi:hypothetical protein
MPPNGFLNHVPACELEKSIKRIKSVLETLDAWISKRTDRFV